MSTQIVDVYWDNNFNPEAEANTGTDGVMIKGGQGAYNGYDDKKCQQIAQAESIHMPHGIYWQQDARHSPEEHKAAIKAFFDKHGFGTMGLFLACEMPFYPCPDALYNLMPYAYYKPIESVWRGIHSYTGAWPGIYISISKWKLIFGKCPLSLQQEIAASARLWVAQYKVNNPDQIGQWPLFDWWQYTEGPDYSVTTMSEEAFKVAYGDPIVNPIPEIPPASPAAPTPAELRRDALQEAINAIESLK